MCITCVCGRAVNVETLMDVAQRTQMVMDRIAYEANPNKFAETGAQLHRACMPCLL